jgi:hypothetical protein
MDVSWDSYIRVVFPFLLCGISLLIVRTLEYRFIDSSEVIRPLALMGLVSTGWTFFYAVSISGFELHSIRYQVLGYAIPFLLAYWFVSLVVKRDYSILAILSGIFPLGMIFISITRSYLISIALIVVGFIWVVPKVQAIRTVQAFGRLIVITLFFVVLTWLAVEQIRPGFTELWMSRLLEQRTSSGLDLTFLTRIAEYSGQWQLLTSDLVSFLFGRGMGSEYWWDSSYLTDAHWIKGTQSVSYAGHSMWMYSLYSGGLLFGLIVPGIVIHALWKVQKIARRPELIAVPRLRKEAALPFFALLSYIGSQTLTSNPFGFRLSGLLLGFVLGIGYWLYDCSKYSFAFVPVERYGLRRQTYVTLSGWNNEFGSRN